MYSSSFDFTFNLPFAAAQARLEQHHEYRCDTCNNYVSIPTATVWRSTRSRARCRCCWMPATSCSTRTTTGMGYYCAIAINVRSANEIDEKLKHVSACQETLESVWTRVTSYLQDELNMQLLKRDAADVRKTMLI